jgi:hypothetical protein
MWNPRWNDIDRGKLKNSEKTCPTATLSTKNPTGLTWARTQAAVVLFVFNFMHISGNTNQKVCGLMEKYELKKG